MYSLYVRKEFSSTAPPSGQNVHNPQKCTQQNVLVILYVYYVKSSVLKGVCYLRSESCSGAGGTDGSMAGEGDGQTSDPVLTGLVLTHQPALQETQHGETKHVKLSKL